MSAGYLKENGVWDNFWPGHACSECGLSNPNPHERYCRSCKGVLTTVNPPEERKDS
jgi:hypothetical protein